MPMFAGQIDLRAQEARPNYTDAMMEAVCEALAEWNLSYWQISNLAADLPGEYRFFLMDQEARTSASTEAERKPVAAE